MIKKIIALAFVFAFISALSSDIAFAKDKSVKSLLTEITSINYPNINALANVSKIEQMASNKLLVSFSNNNFYILGYSKNKAEYVLKYSSETYGSGLVYSSATSLPGDRVAISEYDSNSGESYLRVSQYVENVGLVVLSQQLASTTFSDMVSDGQRIYAVAGDSLYVYKIVENNPVLINTVLIAGMERAANQILLVEDHLVVSSIIDGNSIHVFQMLNRNNPVQIGTNFVNSPVQIAKNGKTVFIITTPNEYPGAINGLFRLSLNTPNLVTQVLNFGSNKKESLGSYGDNLYVLGSSGVSTEQLLSSYIINRPSLNLTLASEQYIPSIQYSNNSAILPMLDRVMLSLPARFAILRAN